MKDKTANKNNHFMFFATSGLIGGLAEIVWMHFYNLNSSIGLQDISNEIANTLRFLPENPYIGLIIHLSLSLLIGIAFGKLIFEKLCKNNFLLTIFSSLIILACIWCCAFKLILPVINPDMATIVPNAISFASKMLFGACMAFAYTIFIWGKK